MADELEITIWNVEHGSAMHAMTPNGRHIIMDAGRSRDFSPAQWLKLQYQVDRPHLFTLSHPDADHIDDIQSVAALNPQVFIRNKTVPQHLVFSCEPPQSEPHRTYWEFDHKYIYPIPDDSPLSTSQPANWGGVAIYSYQNCYPDCEFSKLNDYSNATFLLYQNLVFLFPGDLEAPGWEALLKQAAFRQMCTPSIWNLSQVRILIAPHHGREAGVYQPFLDLYQPHLTIMSDTYGNETTDWQSYYDASLGYDVYNTTTERYETRYVVTTKTNNYVRIAASPALVWVCMQG